jgi:hypothetical protein
MNIKQKSKMKITSILFITSVLIMSASVNAATVNFTGTLGFIEIDNDSSTYSGFNIGDSFSGSFTYGNSFSDASSIDITAPISADYSFTGVPYGGFIIDGSITTTGMNSLLGIGNDDDMGDDAVIINNLYGAGSTTATTATDNWSIDSSNSTQAFGLALYSLDTSLFSGLSFQVIPPTLGEADYAIFYITEQDELGNSIYLATGKLTTISAVPVPAAVWLFGSGLIGLIGLARAKI